MATFLSNYMWEWLALTIAALVHVGLILNLVAVSALFFIWLERKISGRIQDRLGQRALAANSAGYRRLPTVSSC